MLHLNDNSKCIQKDNQGIVHFIKFMQPCATLLQTKLYVYLGVSFRTYIQNKPNKYGMKLFELCDSAVSYILSAIAYTGSAGGVDNSIQSLLSNSVLIILISHCFYMDCFYTDPALLSFMWNKRILQVGAVIQNRKGLPEELINKLKKHIHLKENKILAIKWSARGVYTLSTKHKAMTSTINMK